MMKEPNLRTTSVKVPSNKLFEGQQATGGVMNNNGEEFRRIIKDQES